MPDKQETLSCKSFYLNDDIVKGIDNARKHYLDTMNIKISEGEILRMFLPQSPLKEFMPKKDEEKTSNALEV